MARVEWNGGPCPVPAGTYLNVWLGSDKNPMPTAAPERLYWEHQGNNGDIVAYEVLELTKPVDNSAKKFDAAKLPVVAGAINYFPRALLALASDSEYGFRKYGAWGGWRAVEDGQFRYTQADGRHLVMESIEGPYDAESGIAHAIMHAWNAMARVEKMLEQGEIELRRGNDIGPDGKPVPGTHRVVTL